ncbi:MAG TPA: Fe-S-containing hydro-lyase [Candidatus Aphodomonas merdavium]|nr:Fe-S-containing hydro-lyase [Candidatus Aphodomonas merdavium]
MENIRISLPLDPQQVKTLRAGDTVLLTGTLYTGRDAAHKRLVACIERGEPLPIPLENQLIYYVGPAPASPGHAVGSAGPTTSYRMDAYTPALLERGLLGMMGKGKRGPAVIEAMKKRGAVYFGAVGGAAALISRRIESAEVVAYEDLGAEAIHRFVVRDFPALVLIDSLGNNLYELGPAQYRTDGAQA